ncbi:MAG: ComEC/Rec2 family competence protein [Mycoplasma sp.]
MAIFIPDEWKLSQLSKELNATSFFFLRTEMKSYIDDIYQEPNNQIIRMFIFNDKFYYEDFYSNYKDLGILHLFVVSGLHVSCLCIIINKITGRWKLLNLIIKICLCFFLFYLSNLSISILRILICYVIKIIFYKKKFDSLELNLYVAVIIGVLLPNDAGSYSYILSMMCTIAICIIARYVKSKILVLFLINTLISFLTLPIIIKFNGEINILGFINGLIFNYIIIAFYIFELVFCWMPFMVGFNNVLLGAFNDYFRILSNMYFITEVEIKDWVLITIYLIEIILVNILGIRYFINNKQLINYNYLYV